MKDEHSPSEAEIKAAEKMMSDKQMAMSLQREQELLRDTEVHLEQQKLKGYERFLPLDKSWIIRMGLLDIIHAYKDIKAFLDKQTDLSDDLLALKRASEIWDSDEPVDVGESGTLYRLLQFASWKLNLNKKFIKKGTLKDRKITNVPSIINLNTNELLKLDNI